MAPDQPVHAPDLIATSRDPIEIRDNATHEGFFDLWCGEVVISRLYGTYSAALAQKKEIEKWRRSVGKA